MIPSNPFNNIASTISLPVHAGTNFSGNNFIFQETINLKNHTDESKKFFVKTHEFDWLKEKEDSGSFLTSSLKTIKKLGFSFFNKTLSNLSSFIYAKKVPSAQARKILQSRLKQEKIINTNSSSNNARVKRDVESDKAPSAQKRKIPQSRLQQEKIINTNSSNNPQVKHDAKSDVDKEYMNALFKIGHNLPLEIEEKDLKNLKCNFSTENGTTDILNERILIKDIYAGVEKFFTDVLEAKEAKNQTRIDELSKDLLLNYKRFNLLSFMIFNSGEHVPSAVINEYLNTFTKLMNQFWEIEDKETISQIQSLELRKILDAHWSYELIKLCTPNECKDLFSNLENSMGFGFLASTSLYTTKEDWSGFLEKYLNYWKQVSEKVPNYHKEVIRNKLGEFFLNFLKARGLKHEMVLVLKKKLEEHEKELLWIFDKKRWIVTEPTPTPKPTPTTTPKPTPTTTPKPTPTTTPKPTTQDTTTEAIASASTERTSTTQFEESTTQDTTTEAIASASTERTSTTQFEESSTQDTTTEAIASVSTERTSTTQFEESS
ncbi:MAG: hypothetical protein ACRDDW_03465, partial [Candidatus Rhabdochlamydia sp.]